MRKYIFMIHLYLLLTGAYLYYCQSKYFPSNLYKINAVWSTWLALTCCGIATVLVVREYGWASGLLLAISALSLSLVLIQFAAVLGKAYFYGLVALAHGLVLIDLIY